MNELNKTKPEKNSDKMWNIRMNPMGRKHCVLLLNLFHVFQDVVEDLDGHVTVRLRVQSLVDLAERSLSDHRLDHESGLGIVVQQLEVQLLRPHDEQQIFSFLKKNL